MEGTELVYFNIIKKSLKRIVIKGIIKKCNLHKFAKIHTNTPNV